MVRRGNMLWQRRGEDALNLLQNFQPSPRWSWRSTQKSAQEQEIVIAAEEEIPIDDEERACPKAKPSTSCHTRTLLQV